MMTIITHLSYSPLPRALTTAVLQEGALHEAFGPNLAALLQKPLAAPRQHPSATSTTTHQSRDLPTLPQHDPTTTSTSYAVFQSVPSLRADRVDVSKVLLAFQDAPAAHPTTAHTTTPPTSTAALQAAVGSVAPSSPTASTAHRAGPKSVSSIAEVLSLTADMDTW